MATVSPEAPRGAASLAELRDVAIEREPDRYFAATLAPAALRYDLVVLAAFAAEVSRIPDQVREPLAGEIRLQWWRDALADGGSEVAAGHPVAVAMRATIAKFALPATIVEGVIDAQADALHGERPANEAALRARIAASEGDLFRLAARVCAGGETGDDARAAGLAGLAYGLARGLAHAPADGAARLLIPHALASDEDLAPASDGDVPDDARLRSALEALSAMARAAHADVAVRLRQMPRHRRLAFLPLAMVRPYLHALEREMNQPGARPFEPLPIGRLWRIGWAHASGRL